MNASMRGILFFLCLLLTACGFADKGAIVDIMKQRDQAISEKDIQRFANLLSDDFSENGKNREQKIEEVARLFAQFERLEMRSHDRTIRLHGPYAECEQSYTLRAFQDGTWRSLVQRERIHLKKTAHGWKITGGL